MGCTDGLVNRGRGGPGGVGYRGGLTYRVEFPHADRSRWPLAPICLRSTHLDQQGLSRSGLREGEDHGHEERLRTPPEPCPRSLSDLTERRRAEEALQRTQRDLELILKSAGEGIYGLDRQGLTTFVNPAAAEMLGWEPDELLRKSAHAVIHHTRADGSPFAAEKCPIYAAFSDGAIHRVNDEVFWRKDGTSFPVEYVSESRQRRPSKS